MPPIENGELPDLGSPEANEARELVIDDIAVGAGLKLEPPEGTLNDEAKPPIEGEVVGKTIEGTDAPLAEGTAPVEPAKGAVAADERAPDTWKPAVAAKWAAVDPEVRAEIRRREDDIKAFVSEATPQINVAKSFEKMLAPYGEAFTKYNVNPWDHVQGLLSGHYKLLFGTPAEKVGMFRQLAQDAGLDVAKMVDPDAPPDAAQQHFTAQLRLRDEELARMRRELDSIAAGTKTQHQERLSKDIEAWSKDKPNFDKLTARMTELINSKAAKSLEEAYDLAELQDPVTRAERLEREAKKLADANATAVAARTAAARKGSSTNVKSRGSGRAAPKEETIDDTLTQTLQNIRSRS